MWKSGKTKSLQIFIFCVLHKVTKKQEAFSTFFRFFKEVKITIHQKRASIPERMPALFVSVAGQRSVLIRVSIAPFFANTSMGRVCKQLQGRRRDLRPSTCHPERSKAKSNFRGLSVSERAKARGVSRSGIYKRFDLTCHSRCYICFGKVHQIF